MDKNEKIAGAIEVLQERLNGLVQQVAEQKRIINSLRASIGEQPLYNDVVVENIAASAGRPDEFYAQPLSTCVRAYLERRKQACAASDILVGLQNGGFDFDAAGWKEKDRLRILAVTLAKNTKAFHRLPNGTFGLLSWYDPKAIAGARRGGEDETEDEEVPAAPPKSDKAAKAAEGSA
jgi:hypothetical protein